ncbi:hypothetical protein Tco_0833890 [Tanacetum coccineum]
MLGDAPQKASRKASRDHDKYLISIVSGFDAYLSKDSPKTFVSNVGKFLFLDFVVVNFEADLAYLILGRSFLRSDQNTEISPLLMNKAVKLIDSMIAVGEEASEIRIKRFTVSLENENFKASLQLENAHLKQTYKDLFESVQRSKVETHQCDEAKVKDDFDEIETRNIETTKFEAYFEKLENTKVVLERQLARKVDDSKAEKDQFLKEINHLRTQLDQSERNACDAKQNDFDSTFNLTNGSALRVLKTKQFSGCFIN